MEASEVSELRRLARESVKAATSAAPRSAFRRDRMVVRAVNGTTLDVDGGTAAVPLKLVSVPMTTACSGVRVGDVVIVDTYMHVPVAIGVLAR